MAVAPAQYTTDPHRRYPRPAMTVDIVLLRDATPTGVVPWVLLIQRGHPPYVGSWALPGGFVDPNEALLAAAMRELAEETGLTDVDLQQIGAFDDPGRDPRGWVVSVVYAARGAFSSEVARAGDDADHVAWWPVDDLPTLAFDHADLIAAALSRL